MDEEEKIPYRRSPPALPSSARRLAITEAYPRSHTSDTPSFRTPLHSSSSSSSSSSDVPPLLFGHDDHTGEEPKTDDIPQRDDVTLSLGEPKAILSDDTRARGTSVPSDVTLLSIVTPPPVADLDIHSATDTDGELEKVEDVASRLASLTSPKEARKFLGETVDELERIMKDSEDLSSPKGKTKINAAAREAIRSTSKAENERLIREINQDVINGIIHKQNVESLLETIRKEIDIVPLVHRNKYVKILESAYLAPEFPQILEGTSREDWKSIPGLTAKRKEIANNAKIRTLGEIYKRDDNVRSYANELRYAIKQPITEGLKDLASREARRRKEDKEFEKKHSSKKREKKKS